MEVEFTIHIILNAKAGSIFKKDLRNALDLTHKEYLKCIHLMMNSIPAFKEKYATYHETSQRIPISLALQIVEHLYDEGKVTVTNNNKI